MPDPNKTVDGFVPDDGFVADDEFVAEQPSYTDRATRALGRIQQRFMPTPLQEMRFANDQLIKKGGEQIRHPQYPTSTLVGMGNQVLGAVGDLTEPLGQVVNEVSDIPYAGAPVRWLTNLLSGAGGIAEDVTQKVNKNVLTTMGMPYGQAREISEPLGGTANLLTQALLTEGAVKGVAGGLNKITTPKSPLGEVQFGIERGLQRSRVRGGIAEQRQTIQNLQGDLAEIFKDYKNDPAKSLSQNLTEKVKGYRDNLYNQELKAVNRHTDVQVNVGGEVLRKYLTPELLKSDPTAYNNIQTTMELYSGTTTLPEMFKKLENLNAENAPIYNAIDNGKGYKTLSDVQKRASKELTDKVRQNYFKSISNAGEKNVPDVRLRRQALMSIEKDIADNANRIDKTPPTVAEKIGHSLTLKHLATKFIPFLNKTPADYVMRAINNLQKLGEKPRAGILPTDYSIPAVLSESETSQGLTQFTQPPTRGFDIRNMLRQDVRRAKYPEQGFREDYIARDIEDRGFGLPQTQTIYQEPYTGTPLGQNAFGFPETYKGSADFGGEFDKYGNPIDREAVQWVGQMPYDEPPTFNMGGTPPPIPPTNPEPRSPKPTNPVANVVTGNTYAAQAQKLGVKYNGVDDWASKATKKTVYRFSDPQNGGYFTVKQGESLEDALAKHREKFAEPKAEKQLYEMTDNDLLIKKTYGISSEEYTYRGKQVKINFLPKKKFIVYQTKSGWLLSEVKDADYAGQTYGGTIKGVGKIGYNTPEEAIKGGLDDLIKRNPDLAEKFGKKK